MGNFAAKEDNKVLFGVPMPLTPAEEKEAIFLLRKSVLLRECTDAELLALVKKMEKKIHKKGELLTQENEPQNRMYIIARGTTHREKIIDGQPHQIDTKLGGTTVGSLHVVWKDPAYATTRCYTDVITYELPSEVVVEQFKNSEFALNVAKGLAYEIREYTKSLSTPLLEQHPKKTSYVAVTVAAGVESFYRAALNAILNQQLTGQKAPTLFPNMHIQIPTRIVYINGLKGVRAYLDQNVKPDEYSNPTLVRLAAAISPGLIMTPMSSILEASNAGHSNPEPIYKRWTRGLAPRAAREVIFGIGLNQLSDYCEERIPSSIENKALRTASGSLLAGVLSGYFSHVVHNMSTLKLMNPNKSYGTHFSEYVTKAEERLPANIPFKRAAATFTACVFPRGVIIRTTQIVGSFIVLNGTITLMQKYLPPGLNK